MAYPCTALTDAQAIEAGLPSDIEHRELLGVDTASCGWDYSREDLTGGGAGVVWPLDGLNLVDLYERRDEMAYFEELTVLGYPAVFAHTDDWRGKGHCILHVGVSDTLAFYVGVDVAPGKHVLLDSCELAESVAAIVVENLQAK
jgi:hypothetical protein